MISEEIQNQSKHVLYIIYSSIYIVDLSFYSSYFMEGSQLFGKF